MLTAEKKEFLLIINALRGGEKNFATGTLDRKHEAIRKALMEAGYRFDRDRDHKAKATPLVLPYSELPASMKRMYYMLEAMIYSLEFFDPGRT